MRSTKSFAREAEWFVNHDKIMRYPIRIPKNPWKAQESLRSQNGIRVLNISLSRSPEGLREENLSKVSDMMEIHNNIWAYILRFGVVVSLGESNLSDSNEESSGTKSLILASLSAFAKQLLVINATEEALQCCCDEISSIPTALGATIERFILTTLCLCPGTIRGRKSEVGEKEFPVIPGLKIFPGLKLEWEEGRESRCWAKEIEDDGDNGSHSAFDEKPFPALGISYQKRASEEDSNPKSKSPLHVEEIETEHHSGDEFGFKYPESNSSWRTGVHTPSNWSSLRINRQLQFSTSVSSNNYASLAYLSSYNSSSSYPTANGKFRNIRHSICFCIAQITMSADLNNYISMRNGERDKSNLRTIKMERNDGRRDTIRSLRGIVDVLRRKADFLTFLGLERHSYKADQKAFSQLAVRRRLDVPDAVPETCDEQHILPFKILLFLRKLTHRSGAYSMTRELGWKCEPDYREMVKLKLQQSGGSGTTHDRLGLAPVEMGICPGTMGSLSGAPREWLVEWGRISELARQTYHKFYLASSAQLLEDNTENASRMQWSM
ncbi:uncharacterized protein BDR25DRAFT_361006 [Lindgomyces ingoldianus]|uniref:Uncharacterized protein n=1 Tax=Lindgomyces ingoldianus TaxID=673940 RepID=A0ACB6QFG1_9PLEO|nr:uncharacterized protein BDR25DRAFT_361006 [Lindgomyces ingoldianus]KAF2465102.1 hypothetical protein BDR25DRAFT_361006 [Lindgomyces ingoldianus]